MCVWSISTDLDSLSHLDGGVVMNRREDFIRDRMCVILDIVLRPEVLVYVASISAYC